MADVIDDDTTAAIRALWQTDNATLPTLVTQPVQSGRLKSPQSTTYAVAESKQGRPRQNRTTGIFYDFRNVKITVYGTKASVVAAMSAIGNIFNRNTKLALSSGARFIDWLPLNSEVIEDKDTKAGQDVWQGIATAEVWSVRTLTT
jgi:hypothetical protein